MIDLHCHILPGIDDGPATPEEALEMCRIAAADGIATLVATPHCNKALYPNDASTILPVYESLRSALAREGIPLELLVAGEVRIDPSLPLFLEANPALCLGGRFVLIEFPSETVPRFADRFWFMLRLKGFKPVLTHPERNREIQRNPDLVAEWVQKGVFTQVTALSLTGEFGPEAQAAALTLLDRGFVHVMASDAHAATRRSPVLSGAAAFLARRIGAEGANRLVEENPRRILDGRDPLCLSPVTGRQRNFRPGRAALARADVL